MNAKKKALGKGLSALLSDSEPDIMPQELATAAVISTINNIRVNSILLIIVNQFRL